MAARLVSRVYSACVSRRLIWWIRGSGVFLAFASSRVVICVSPFFFSVGIGIWISDFLTSENQISGNPIFRRHEFWERKVDTVDPVCIVLALLDEAADDTPNPPTAYPPFHDHNISPPWCFQSFSRYKPGSACPTIDFSLTVTFYRLEARIVISLHRIISENVYP